MFGAIFVYETKILVFTAVKTQKLVWKAVYLTSGDKQNYDVLDRLGETTESPLPYKLTQPNILNNQLVCLKDVNKPLIL